MNWRSKSTTLSASGIFRPAACLGLLAVSWYLGLTFGPTGWLSGMEAFSCLWQGAACEESAILLQIRLPRLINGAIVGCSLAIAGVLSQGYFRNDLASPSVTGAEAAGLLGAATAYVFSHQNLQIWTLPLGAAIGVSAVSTLLASIRSKTGSSSTTVILLLGIAISSFCSAFISLIVSWLARDPYQSGTLIQWLMGNLSSRGWEHVMYAGPLALIGWIWGFRLAGQLDYLAFGHDFSSSVGISIKRVELQILLVIAMLVGASVAIAGGIVFIGLVVPHITRQIFGPQHRSLLFWSGINGMSMVILSDVIAKSAFTFELNTGVVIALIGAPFFALILLRRLLLPDLRGGGR